MRGYATLITLLLVALTGFVAGAVRAPAQTWTQCHPKTSPPFRNDTAMAFDEVNGCLVRFGGSSLTTFHTNETWVWDGVDWSEHFPSRRPTARCGHALAYDSARQRVVLFGGSTAQGLANDTWEWDGSKRTQLSPSVTPRPMHLHAMVYDSVRQRMVVFGGQGWTGAWGIYLNETWEFDGRNWIQCVPPVSPSARIYHAMAFDAARGRTVLFGGYSVAGELNDTWEWDGTNWKQCTPVRSPAARAGHKMACHGGRKSIVLFGGTSNWMTPNPQELCDTWEWDGAAWIERWSTVKPYRGYAMAYDTVRRGVMLIGGSTVAWPFVNTWSWGNPPVAGSGSGRIGTTVDLVFTSENDGDLACLGASSFGSGPVVLGEGRWIDLSPDALFAISAGNLAPAVFSGYRGTLDGHGQAKAAIHLPNAPALIGQRIHTAFVSLDPEAPQGIRSISQTFSFTVAP